ncbi:MAG: hypothetical protein ACKVON_16480 [Beijerinckiaceae bacterium]
MTPFVFEPEARLRGLRDYVHSTDLYEEIAAGAKVADLGLEGPLDFRIRARITHRPRYVFQAAGEPRGVNAATCTFTSGGKGYVAIVTETDHLIIERKPYDEGPAASLSSIAGHKATLEGPTGMRPIEALTALAVHLHKTTLPPPPDRRWMLGQLITSRALVAKDASLLTLEIDKQISNATTRIRITAHDGVVGSMIFILAKR